VDKVYSGLRIHTDLLDQLAECACEGNNGETEDILPMKIDLSFLHVSAFTLLGIAVIVGFYMGHVAQRIRLPSLIGYMIFGVILGPSILSLIDEPMSQRLSFLTEIALGFVALTIGSELSLSSLKRLGSGIISIIFAESLGAFFVVLIAVYLLTRDLPLSIIFGAMAPASAPAGTVAVIQEYKAKGILIADVRIPQPSISPA